MGGDVEITKMPQKASWAQPNAMPASRHPSMADTLRFPLRDISLLRQQLIDKEYRLNKHKRNLLRAFTTR